MTRLPAAALALASCFAAGACAPSSVCEQAAARVAACTGLPAAPSATCDADTAARFLDLSCAQLAGHDGKAEYRSTEVPGALCELFNVFCPEEPPLSGRPTRYPIVLVTGINAAPGSWAAYYQVADLLRADGHEVYEAELNPFGSIAERGAALLRQIEALAERGKVNLIGHSAGGIDGRWVICNGGRDRVASLATIAAPHRGSLLADYVLDFLAAPDSTRERVVSELVRLWGMTISDLAAQHVAVRRLAEDLSPAGMARFNAVCRDDAQVYYQSWTGVSGSYADPQGLTLEGYEPRPYRACAGQLLFPAGARDWMSPLLVPLAGIVGGPDEQPSDGLIRVESARWTNFRGCLGADHMDEIGQYHDDGSPTPAGFDYQRFYRTLAFDLAARGL